MVSKTCRHILLVSCSVDLFAQLIHFVTGNELSAQAQHADLLSEKVHVHHHHHHHHPNVQICRHVVLHVCMYQCIWLTANSVLCPSNSFGSVFLRIASPSNHLPSKDFEGNNTFIRLQGNKDIACSWDSTIPGCVQSTPSKCLLLSTVFELLLACGLIVPLRSLLPSLMAKNVGNDKILRRIFLAPGNFVAHRADFFQLSIERWPNIMRG